MTIIKYSEGSIGNVFEKIDDKEKENIEKKISEAEETQKIEKEASESAPFWTKQN